jgi:hypothetical protein
MNNLQAVIIAVGIAAAGLLHGGIWEFHNESSLLLNKFTGVVDHFASAPKR